MARMVEVLAVLLFGGAFFIFALAVSSRIMKPRSRRPELVDPTTRALALLNERYARGEIDRDEYLERKAFLEP